MSETKILIVEDEMIITQEVRDALENAGYPTPIIAPSGEHAIDQVIETKPDLVLMGIELKGEMDGIEAAEQIRARLDVPVVYITAYADDEILQRVKVSDPFGYILKPFRESKLHSTVEMALYRHRMERKLRESEARYRAVVEDQIEFICRFRPNGTLTFANQAYRQYFHKEPGALIGHGIMPLIFEEDREFVREQFTSLSRDHPVTSYAHRVVMSDGEIRWHEWTERAIYDRMGNLVEYQSVGRDVTERKRMEKAVRYRAEELAALQDTVLDITVEHDLPTLLETIVERAAELLGARAGGMYLCDPEREEARCVVSHNTPDYTGTVLKYGEGSAGTVAETGEPLIIDDYRVWGARAAIYEEDQPFTAVLSAPMTWQGKVTGVIHVLHDVKDRRFTEADLELLTLFANHAAIAVENARLYEETHQRATQLEALREVGLELTAQLNLDGLLHSITSQATNLLGGVGGGLYLYRPEQDVLEFVTSVRRPTVPLGSVLQHGEGLSGRVWESGEPFIVDDYQHWEGRYPQYEGLPLKAVVGVPIRWGDEFLGVLTTESEAKGTFSSADADLLSLFATQAAIAIRNAQLFEDVNRRIAEFKAVRRASLQLTSTLELQPVLEAILESALRFVSADDAHVFLYEDGQVIFGAALFEGRQQEEPYAGPRPHGLTYTVAQRGERIVVQDVMSHPLFEDRRWEGAIVGLPLKCGDEVHGVMNIAFERPHTFSDHELRLLELLATQAAIAIRNARLYEETERRATQARLVYEVGQHVSSELEPDVLLSTIVSAVRDAFDYHNVILLLLDEGADHLTMQSIAGAYDDTFSEDLWLAVGEGMIGYAAATGETQISNDVSTDPHYVRKATEKTRSELAVPIKRGHKVIGVLDLQEDERNAFDEMDVATMETLSTQIATAIENAHLFQAERKRSTQLATVSHVAESITSTLDPHEVPHRTVKLITQTFGYYYASIMLLDPEAGELVFEAGAGGFAGRNPPDFRQRLKEGMIGWAAHLGETVLANNINQEPRYIPAYLPETKSELDVPLKYRDRVIGVLDLQSSELNAFDEHDVMAMEALAGHVAAAIENARLHEEIRKRALEQETLREAALALTTTLERDEVVDRILAQLQEVVPYDTASIQLLRGEQLEIVGGRGFPNPEEVVGFIFNPTRENNPNREVVRTRAPFIVEDGPAVYEEFCQEPHAPAGIRSWLGVPMLIGERLIGMIALDKREPGFYTLEHARLAEAFAAQAAIAIENARLLAAERQRAEEIEGLADIVRGISSTLDLDQVLDTIAAQATLLSGSDAGGVFALDETKNELQWIASHNASPAFIRAVNESSVQIGEGAIGRAAATRQPVQIVDTEAPTYPFQENTAINGIRSILAVPMLKGEALLGGIVLLRNEPGPFSSENVQLLTILADHAAIAVENARLFGQAQREIVERRRTEKALRESEEKYRGLVERSLQGIVIAQDNPVRIRFASTPMQTITGFSPQELERFIPQQIANLIHPEDRQRFFRSFRDRLEGKEISSQNQYRALHKSGETRWVQIYSSRIEYDGAPAAQAAFLDITKRKHLEEQLQRQERLAAVGQLAAGIAHDFRNLLTTIILYAQMGQRKPDLPPGLPQSLETIINESKKAAGLVQQILDFSSRAMIRRRPLNLTAFARNVLDVLQRTIPENIQLSLDVHGAEPEEYAAAFTVEADAGRMQQVLTNLALNARDAMLPQGGGELRIGIERVEVMSGETPPGLEMLAGTPHRAWVCLSVSDTGTGMTEEVQEHLFEPFFTTKDVDKGTGLGLAQVYGIVRQHEGIIDVETEVGKGTTFRICIPAYEGEESGEPEPEEPHAVPRGRGETIMLVEDEEELRSAGRDVLESLGYRVLVAANGNEALALWQTPRWQPRREVDLVITDLVMPEVSGKELVRELRKTEHNLKALAITGYTLKEDDFKALEDAGFADVVRKPFHVEAIAQTIRRVLEED